MNSPHEAKKRVAEAMEDKFLPGIKAIGFLALMAFLIIGATSTANVALPDLSSAAAVAAGLLGVAINHRLPWFALLAMGVAAYAAVSVFLLHPPHPAAGAALTAAIAAFAGLFVDTSEITHPKKK